MVSLPLVFFFGVQTIGGFEKLYFYSTVNFSNNVPYSSIALVFLSFFFGETLVPPYVQRLLIGKTIKHTIRGNMASGIISIPFFLMIGLIGAIALDMLFHIPIRAGALLVTIFVMIMLFSNSYRIMEKWIIAFVSVIGLSFLYELSLVNIDWNGAMIGWVTPSFPKGSMLVIMSVLGAVVMPHNLFLHSEIIQSRQWNLQDEVVIKKQLRYEFLDTLVSMLIGWAINSAMILLAAATFFKTKTPVNELQQANHLLTPLLGTNAAVVFGVALLFSGIASTTTSGMAAGSIFAGMYNEPYDIKDNHSRVGVSISLLVAFVIILFISNPFQGLIISQMILSVQLPFTIFLQVYLTSSEKVMGKYKNSLFSKLLLYSMGAIVTILNIALFVSLF